MENHSKPQAQNATPSVCAKCSLQKTEYIKEYALYKRRSENTEIYQKDTPKIL